MHGCGRNADFHDAQEEHGGDLITGDGIGARERFDSAREQVSGEDAVPVPESTAKDHATAVKEAVVLVEDVNNSSDSGSANRQHAEADANVDAASTDDTALPDRATAAEKPTKAPTVKANINHAAHTITLATGSKTDPAAKGANEKASGTASTGKATAAATATATTTATATATAAATTKTTTKTTANATVNVTANTTAKNSTVLGKGRQAKATNTKSQKADVPGKTTQQAAALEAPKAFKDMDGASSKKVAGSAKTAHKEQPGGKPAVTVAGKTTAKKGKTPSTKTHKEPASPAGKVSQGKNVARKGQAHQKQPAAVVPAFAESSAEAAWENVAAKEKSKSPEKRDKSQSGERMSGHVAREGAAVSDKLSKPGDQARGKANAKGPATVATSPSRNRVTVDRPASQERVQSSRSTSASSTSGHAAADSNTPESPPKTAHPTVTPRVDPRGNRILLISDVRGACFLRLLSCIDTPRRICICMPC